MEIVNLLASTLAGISYFGAAARLTAFDRGCRCHKWHASLIASALIGVLLCAAIEQLLYSPKTTISQALVAFAFFLMTLRAKGNVAYLLRIHRHGTSSEGQ